MWKRHKLTLKFKNRLIGGVPKNREMIATWLDSRAPSEAGLGCLVANGEIITPLPDLATKVAEEIQATDDAEAKVWSGFKTDDVRGLYVDGYHVKSHLKDCANRVRKKGSSC